MNKPINRINYKSVPPSIGLYWNCTKQFVYLITHRFSELRLLYVIKIDWPRKLKKKQQQKAKQIEIIIIILMNNIKLQVSVLNLFVSLSHLYRWRTRGYKQHWFLYLFPLCLVSLKSSWKDIFYYYYYY